MADLEKVLVLDTRTINTLLQSNGTFGLDLLTLNDQRVVILDDVLKEVRFGPASLVETFNSWEIRGQGNPGTQYITPCARGFDLA